MSGAIDFAMASSAFSTFIGAFIAGTFLGAGAGCFSHWLADKFVQLIDGMTEGA